MELTSWIINNENLIYKAANYFSGYASVDDLYQAGCVGIIKASQNYREDMGTKFSSYAYSYILGEMKSLVRQDKTFKISKEMMSLKRKVLEAKELLTQKLMQVPTIEQLSSFLEMSVIEITDILNSDPLVSSIDSCYGNTDVLMHEIISSPQTDSDTLIMLKEYINNLEEPERSIMIQRYYEDMTQSEVAENLGLGQAFVSRREQKVLKKIRQTCN